MTSFEIFLLVIVFLFVILAGFLSAAETSLTAASKAKIHSLAKSGDPRAVKLQEIQSNVGLSLSALLLCNTVLLAFVNSTVGDIVTDNFGKEGLIYAPLIVSFFTVVYAETLPKIIAVSSPERYMMFVNRPLYFIFRVFKPITLAITSFARAHLRFFGYKSTGHDEFAALEELRSVIDMHFSSEKESQNERAMMRSILELRSVDVDEIMVHRKNVTMIDADDSPTRIVEQVLASPFTRLPLWRGEPDNIVGVIHAKALLRAVQAHKGDLNKLDIMSLVSAPWFIPETADLIEQLHAFKTRREHFAIVVDEYGAFYGIVTLEDILEEIVGDIIDEHDIAVRGIRPQDDGSYIIDGTVTIRDINRQLGWELPDEDAATIAGLILYEIRMIPEVGQSFMIKDYRCEIMRRHRNQITLLKVSHISSQVKGS